MSLDDMHDSIRHTSELYFVPRPFSARNGNGRGEPNGTIVAMAAFEAGNSETAKRQTLPPGVKEGRYHFLNAILQVAHLFKRRTFRAAVVPSPQCHITEDHSSRPINVVV